MSRPTVAGACVLALGVVLAGSVAGAGEPRFWFDPLIDLGQTSGCVPWEPETTYCWPLVEGTLTIEVDDPATPQVPDYSGSSGPLELDGHNFSLNRFRVGPGYEISVSGDTADGGFASRTLIVRDLQIDADFDLETAYGYAGSGGEVYVEIDQPGGWCGNWQTVTVDPWGYWEVELSGVICDNGAGLPIDLEPGLYLAAHQWEEDGDQTSFQRLLSTAKSIRCVGFESPLATYPVVVNGNRALPLRARLLDATGAEQTDLDLVPPPVVQVLYDTGAGPAEDITSEALPPGAGDDGNQFVYTDEGQWRFNLKTKNFSSPGLYTVTMETGNDVVYELVPYSTCQMQFVRE